MADTIAKTIKELKADYNEQLSALNKAVSDKREYSSIEAELKKIETSYNEQLELDIFKSIVDLEDFIRRFDFMALSHKRLSEKGVVTGFEEATRRTTLNIKKYCERREFDTKWLYQVEAFNKRIIVRVLTALVEDKSRLSAKLKEVDTSLKMSKFAAEIELGKTPSSNTQMVKHLQEIVTEILPEADIPNVTNHDVDFVVFNSTKSDRSTRIGTKIVDGSSRDFRNLIMGVCYHLLTGEDYEVIYRKIRP